VVSLEAAPEPLQPSLLGRQNTASSTSSILDAARYFAPRGTIRLRAMSRNGLAGFPATVAPGAKDFVTTAPAAILRRRRRQEDAPVCRRR